MWRVDKYKITVKLVINSRRIPHGSAVEKHCFREVVSPTQRPDNIHLILTAEFEPAIPGRGKPQTHALDRAVTGTGDFFYCNIQIFRQLPLQNPNPPTASIAISKSSDSFHCNIQILRQLLLQYPNPPTASRKYNYSYAASNEIFPIRIKFDRSGTKSFACPKRCRRTATGTLHSNAQQP